MDYRDDRGVVKSVNMWLAEKRRFFGESPGRRWHSVACQEPESKPLDTLSKSGSNLEVSR